MYPESIEDSGVNSGLSSTSSLFKLVSQHHTPGSLSYEELKGLQRNSEVKAGQAKLKKWLDEGKVEITAEGTIRFKKGKARQSAAEFHALRSMLVSNSIISGYEAEQQDGVVDWKTFEIQPSEVSIQGMALLMGVGENDALLSNYHEGESGSPFEKPRPPSASRISGSHGKLTSIASIHQGRSADVNTNAQKPNGILSWIGGSRKRGTMKGVGIISCLLIAAYSYLYFVQQRGGLDSGNGIENRTDSASSASVASLLQRIKGNSVHTQSRQSRRRHNHEENPVVEDQNRISKDHDKILKIVTDAISKGGKLKVERMISLSYLEKSENGELRSAHQKFWELDHTGYYILVNGQSIPECIDGVFYRVEQSAVS